MNGSFTDTEHGPDEMRAGTRLLSAGRGRTLESYVARPHGRTDLGGVIVIHHMPGYDEASLETTRRFAARGYTAICPNLHGRYEGATPLERAASCRALGGVPDEQLVGDVDTARRWLLKRPDGGGGIAVVGYCSGGRQAFLAACSMEFDAAVDCYGGFVVGTPPADFPLKVVPLVDLAPRLSCPLLGLFGVDDPRPSPADTAELSAVLSSLGKAHEFHTYEDAGHAFFAVDRPTFRPAAAAAGWEDLIAFLNRTLPSDEGPPPS